MEKPVSDVFTKLLAIDAWKQFLVPGLVEKLHKDFMSFAPFIFWDLELFRRLVGRELSHVSVVRTRQP
jgi:hypothetical protein